MFSTAISPWLTLHSGLVSGGFSLQLGVLPSIRESPSLLTVTLFSLVAGRRRGQRGGRPPSAAALAELHPPLGRQAARRAAPAQERLLRQTGERGECRGGARGCRSPRAGGAPVMFWVQDLDREWRS